MDRSLITLFPNERIVLQTENTRLCGSDQQWIRGNLYLTDHNLVFAHTNRSGEQISGNHFSLDRIADILTPDTYDRIRFLYDGEEIWIEFLRKGRYESRIWPMAIEDMQSSDRHLYDKEYYESFYSIKFKFRWIHYLITHGDRNLRFRDRCIKLFDSVFLNEVEYARKVAPDRYRRLQEKKKKEIHQGPIISNKPLKYVKGRAMPPFTSRSAEGVDVHLVERRFREAGFLDILVRAREYPRGWKYRSRSFPENSVFSVSIDGDAHYSQRWYRLNAPVTITYISSSQPEEDDGYD